MQVVTGKYAERYQQCYELAKKYWYLPTGIPTLYIEECPSVIFPLLENASQTFFEGNGIVINRKWADKCLQENIPEYEFILLHELRHFHQKAVISRYRECGETGNDSEAEIVEWEKNFTDYKRNNGDENSRNINASQRIERDANAYAVVLLNIMHVNDGMELNLGLPDITASDVDRYMKRKELQETLIRFRQNLSDGVTVKKAPKIGRNDLCPCGSGLKYKKCKCPQYHQDYR